MLHSIYDLSAVCKQTSGDVPEKLVGASTTVVGSKMYLFGGRLVAERRMVSDLYIFDLETLVWERFAANAEDDVPRARYFHSADHWNNRLVIFGGMSTQLDSTNPEELCVLNDVRMFDLSMRRWLPAKPAASLSGDQTVIPRARYAHLSSVTANRLLVIGGQDYYNTWLDDVCAFDLSTQTWVQRREYPRHCGTYRSIAVSSDEIVRLQQDQRSASDTYGPTGASFSPNGPTRDKAYSSSNLIHLPSSTPSTVESPADVYLYSNYNFTDVKRELEVFSPQRDHKFSIQDRSANMTGDTFPPGLRFPSGAILGHHLIIAGTYLAQSYQSFSIWALDLISMTWSKIDPGKAIDNGSWFRSCLYSDANRLMVFGNRDGNLVEDYNRRLLSWDHVAIIDMEAFGIYRPPRMLQDISSQELGLAALEQKVLTDFELVCEDGRTIGCSRRLLEDRWPWFKQERLRLAQRAQAVMSEMPESAMHVPLPDLPGSAPDDAVAKRPDPRMTPRSLTISEPYPIVLALLQYFYTQALITPLQHAPAVMTQLLILSSTYKITHLQTIVKHAMHRALSNASSVGVYEVATLCSCRSLQIRALKTVMAYTQKKPSKSKDIGGGGRSDGGGGGGPPRNAPGGNGPSKDLYLSRPRGTSDAQWRTNPAMGNGHSNNSYTSRPLPTHVEDPEPTPLPIPRNMPLDVTRQSRPLSSASIISTDEASMFAIAESMTPLVQSPILPERPGYSPSQTDDDSDPILGETFMPMHDKHPYAVDDVPEDVSESRPTSRITSRDSDGEYYSERESGGYTLRVSLPSFDLPRRSGSATPDTMLANSSRFSAMSDTPSLVSSRGSSRGSTSFSPLTPNTPQFPLSSGDSTYTMPIIEERYQEDLEFGNRRTHPYDEDEGIEQASKFGSTSRNLSSASTLQVAPSAPTFERKQPPAKLSINNPVYRPVSSDTLSPDTASSFSAPSIPPTPSTPLTPATAFSRFFGGGKKDSKNGNGMLNSPSTTSFSEKAFKAESKKAHKEEMKLRRELLAIKLAESSKKSAAATDEASVKSKEERKMEPVVSMYGNGDAMTTL